MSNIIHFLDLDFTLAEPAEWRELLLQPSEGFRYLVTPNVDHVVQLSKHPELREAYSAADWRMCDSRILEMLGRLRKIELKSYPGSDLVRDILADPRSQPLTIAAVGPSRDDFEILHERLPMHNLVRIDSPFMDPGSPEWETTLRATEDAQADLTMLCISFPKQELFAHALKLRGRARGTAICAGASLDFLTGRQKRAPELFRRTGTEWLYRLLSQPRRLWRRYLVDGPQIFVLYLRSRRK